MNSLSLLRGIKILLVILFLTACQNLRTREDVRRQPRPPTPVPSPAPTRPSERTPPEVTELPQVSEEEEDIPVVEAPPPPPMIPTMPRIGIILGAGGARTYAHIGFLHELARLKIPVSAIGGIELAAPMAALYGHNELANNVEWQMFKLKEEDFVKKSLLGSTSRNNEVTTMKDFIKTSFARVSLSDFKIPFACPAYNFSRNQTYLMNKGSLEQVLYACMAYPPLFRPYRNQVAAVRDVSSLAAYLRQRGANYIVFVNVLPLPAKRNIYGETSSTDNVLWSEIAGLYNKPLTGVDTVISLDVGDYGTMDFDKRRDMMKRGAASATKSLEVLTRKWGL